jgi:hypothetical protein
VLSGVAGALFGVLTAVDQPQPVRSQIEKVVIIPANLTRLNADAGVVERRERRYVLREQFRLNLKMPSAGRALNT